MLFAAEVCAPISFQLRWWVLALALLLLMMAVWLLLIEVMLTCLVNKTELLGAHSRGYLLLHRPLLLRGLFLSFPSSLSSTLLSSLFFLPALPLLTSFTSHQTNSSFLFVTVSSPDKPSAASNSQQISPLALAVPCSSPPTLTRGRGAGFRPGDAQLRRDPVQRPRGSRQEAGV